MTNDVSAMPDLEQRPEDALETVRQATAETLVIVDLDETLFLRNSTEEYLNSVYPRVAGAVFMMGIKAVKPWRFLPPRLRSAKVSKDWCLVVAVTLLFPWTLLVWRRRAKALAQAYWNRPLIQAINDNPNAEVVVATLGFDYIVNPLLRHLPVKLSQATPKNVIACRFWQGAEDRFRGKCALLQQALGAEVVAGAIAITDAIYDTPLLAAVKTPYLVVWPDAEYLPAMSDVYLPLFYSEKIKNPNSGHFVRRVLLVHWAFLVIALSFLSPHPILNAVCLLALVLSYWCVYEIGYQENDLIGERYEKKPILSEAYLERSHQRSLSNTPAPWAWAIAIALPALLLLEMAKRSGPLPAAFAEVMQKGPRLLVFDLLVWIIFLIAVRLTFWLYNRFNEEARIWIYPLLQVQKLFGFTLLLGINGVGAMLLLALTTARWLHYAIYRCGGNRWQFPLNISSLLLFVMMLLASVLGSETPSEFVTLQAAIALAYCTLRATREGLELGQRISILGQDPSI
jgi:hypothetical protein